MQKSISVIIPSYNSSKTIKKSLKTLKNLNSPYLNEVLVVDSSDDGKMDDIIAEYKSKQIKFINAGIRVMPAIGRNIGAEKATGRILAFLDADAYPAHDWLDKIVIAYKKGYLAGGGGIDIPYFQKHKPIAVAQYFLQLNEYMNNGKDRIKDFVPSCNLYCDKELFHKVGGFPEIRASEDTLFGLRINKIQPLWFIPDAKVYHIFREEWRSFFDNQKLLGKYVLIYRRMHYDSFIYKGFMPLILLPGFLIVKLFRIIVMRVFKAGWSRIYSFFFSSPIFLVGLFYWTMGFVKGCFEPDIELSKQQVV